MKREFLEFRESVIAKANDLEPSGAPTDKIVSASIRACKTARDKLKVALEAKLQLERMSGLEDYFLQEIERLVAEDVRLTVFEKRLVRESANPEAA